MNGDRTNLETQWADPCCCAAKACKHDQTI